MKEETKVETTTEIMSVIAAGMSQVEMIVAGMMIGVGTIETETIEIINETRSQGDHLNEEGAHPQRARSQRQKYKTKDREDKS